MQYAKIIQKLGFPATFKEFKVQNIVGSCDVKFPIRLEGMAFSQQMFCNVSKSSLLPCCVAVCAAMRGCMACAVHAAAASLHNTWTHCDGSSPFESLFTPN